MHLEDLEHWLIDQEILLLVSHVMNQSENNNMAFKATYKETKKNIVILRLSCKETYIVALLSAEAESRVANIVAMFPLFMADELQLFQWPKEKSRF